MESELATIPRMRRIFKDTKANLDALTNLKDEDMGYAIDEKQLYRQNGDGAANWEQITYFNYITTGNYTGNLTANRAIAHGLSLTPKIIIISATTDDMSFIIMGGVAGIWELSGANHAAVTAPDSTNFYVGNAGNYHTSANHDTIPYYWIAVG